MNKIQSFSNCLAVFHYAAWRYPKSIISLTSNNVTYTVDIQLEHESYDSEMEIEVLKHVIVDGAVIDHLKPESADYDIIVIRYYYED